jgi:type IV secretion system protein VirB5
MIAIRRHLILASLILSIAGAPCARAQWAVIDVHAIGQLVQQVQTMQQQLQTARSQLQQAQDALQSMSGGRGMEKLLGGTVRNYLPTDWAGLTGTLQSAGAAYASLAANLQTIVGANAVLSPTAMASLSPAERQQITAARQRLALNQALFRDALAATSNRFTAIQTLIDAIGTAGDQKAILDLHARIGAEQGMLQNEQTKLQVLYQSAQAEDAAQRQQLREQVIAGHGRFDARFQPVP